jgi:hypothetical protein
MAIDETVPDDVWLDVGYGWIDLDSSHPPQAREWLGQVMDRTAGMVPLPPLPRKPALLQLDGSVTHAAAAFPARAMRAWRRN